MINNEASRVAASILSVLLAPLEGYPSLESLGRSKTKKDTGSTMLMPDTVSNCDERPIIVMEVWHLKPDAANEGLAVMQQMDRLLGSSTHGHPGWCGHASFYQRNEKPCEVIIIYPWRNRELHAQLISGEEPLLQEFHKEYCTSQREIHYYSQLFVEVEDRGLVAQR